MTLIFLLLGAVGPGTASEPEDKLVSQWNLADFSEGEVKNQIPAGGALSVAGSEEPKLVEEVGVKGLLFGEGERLVGKSKDIPILGGFGEAGQPFGVRLVIVPLNHHLGPYGGLLQAMAYKRSGFRLVINQVMKLAIEIQSGEEAHVFVGNTVLTFGTVYTVEVKFDGTKAILLLDGQVDGKFEMGLPVPYSDIFLIGATAGDNCFFNGVIGEVSIFALKP